MFSHRECSWSTEPVDKTEFQNGSIYDRVRWSMSEARKAGDHRPGSEFFRPTVQALLWNTKRNLLDQEEWDVSIAGL